MVKNECSCLTILDQKLIKTQDDFQQLIQESTDKGWEGLMLRADKPYKGKRSKDLLKYKAFSDAEYEVVDTEMGPFRYIKDGKECEETMLSSVIISHKDNLVGVGSGFSVEQRQEFYKDPKKILGKIIQVQYFEETKNHIKFSKGPAFKQENQKVKLSKSTEDDRKIMESLEKLEKQLLRDIKNKGK
jgi:ATP-dependent DNA ligase